MVGVVKIEPNCCPTCGQRLPADEPVDLRLTPQEHRLYDMIRRAGQVGISLNGCFERMYAGHDGGPDSGPKIIHAFVNLINRKLRQHRQKIVSARGVETTYRVTQTHRPVKRGERRLTEREKERLIHLYRTDAYTQVELAKMFGVSQAHVSVIVHYGDRDVQRAALAVARQIGGRVE